MRMSVAEAAIATGLIVVAPGPAMAISVSSAVDGGRRAGLLAIAGLSAGIVLHAAIAACGLSVLFAADERIRSVLQVAGALFLAVVGVRMILRGLRGAAPVERQPSKAYLARGLLTNILNPWILGFYLTLVPMFAGAGAQGAVVAAGIVVAIHVAQLALWHGLLVVAASSVGVAYESRAPVLRLAAGGALVATGVWFLLR